MSPYFSKVGKKQQDQVTRTFASMQLNAATSDSHRFTDAAYRLPLILPVTYQAIRVLKAVRLPRDKKYIRLGWLSRSLSSQPTALFCWQASQSLAPGLNPYKEQVYPNRLRKGRDNTVPFNQPPLSGQLMKITS